MLSEPRKQSMAWMETDYSKHTHFLGALGIMGKTAPLKFVQVHVDYALNTKYWYHQKTDRYEIS